MQTTIQPSVVDKPSMSTESTIDKLNTVILKSDSCIIPQNLCNKSDKSNKFISKINKTNKEQKTEEEIGKLIIDQVKRPPFFYFFHP